MGVSVGGPGGGVLAAGAPALSWAGPAIMVTDGVVEGPSGPVLLVKM